MKSSWSIKQAWTALILFTVIIPVLVAVFWYASMLYEHKLNNALAMERNTNESLRDKIESEVNHLKTLLVNKSDGLSLLLDKYDDPEAIKDINKLLGLIVEREPLIHEAMILSKQTDVIAIIDHDLNYSGDKILTASELNVASSHMGFDEALDHPEVIIPLMGRIHVGSPKPHRDKFAFSIAVPISSPVKAILIALIDVDELWFAYAHKGHESDTGGAQDYMLGRRGELITKIAGSDYVSGDLLTHMAITRTALINGEWPTDVSYTGVSDQPVYGTLTVLPSLGWTLISEISVDRITQPIMVSMAKIFVLNLLGIIIFVWLVLYLANKILRPIAHICEAINHVARGDYGFSLEFTGIRELDDMVSRINYMTDMRQKSEKALQESERNLHITLNSIGDAVITTDVKGNVMRMNPVAEQLTGWSIKDAQGKSIRSVFIIVNASTRKPIENPFDKVIETGETVFLSDHTTLISKNSKEYQIADSASPIYDKGNVLGMVLIFNDITEQYQLREMAEKSKRDMDAIMDNSPAGIYVKDMEGRYIFVNRKYKKLFHIGHEDIIGNTDYDLFAREFADGFRDNDKFVQETRSTLEFEESVPHEDKIHTYASIKFPLFNKNNEVYAVCGISTDITERKRQEEQLRHSQKMDALGKLVGGVAHDYNNMLGVILGYSEILKKSVGDQPELLEHIDKIYHAGGRGAKLTKKLLSFSSKTPPVDTNIININKLLMDEQDMLEKTLTVRIYLLLDLADDLWLVWLDSGDLEDAVLNMSINAMHAIDGNGDLTLRTSNVNLNRINANQLGLDPGDYVLLEITDTGCGMDSVILENIFDPFFSTKGDKGSGLGLSQVYGFVERSGGTVKVYSEVGLGAHFALYFPRCYERDIENQETESHHLIESKTNETILVVDDESALVDLTCEILSEKNFNVIGANSAEQALQILATEPIDLLLSDIIMPEMDGYQLAAKVQEKYPQVKIQLVSGYTDKYQVDTSLSDLHNNILYKPLDAYALLKRVRTQLDIQI